VLRAPARLPSVQLLGGLEAGPPYPSTLAHLEDLVSSLDWVVLVFAGVFVALMVFAVLYVRV